MRSLIIHNRPPIDRVNTFSMAMVTDINRMPSLGNAVDSVAFYDLIT